MPSSLTCPVRTELLAVALGRSPSRQRSPRTWPDAQAASRRLEQLKAELALLRADRQEAFRHLPRPQVCPTERADSHPDDERPGRITRTRPRPGTRQTQRRSGLSVRDRSRVRPARPRVRRAAAAGRDRQIPGDRPVSPTRPGGGLPRRPSRAGEGPGAQARARSDRARRPLTRSSRRGRSSPS